MNIADNNNSAADKISLRSVLKSATGVLLVINALFFIATILFQLKGIDLANIGGLHFFLAKDFHIYQFITYLFLHANLWHLISNMLFLWLLGTIVENCWGPKRFAIYYIICGIVGGLIQEVAQYVSLYFTLVEQEPATTFGAVFEVGKQLSNELNSWITIGSSSAVCAIVLAFGIMFSERLLFSIKVKWLIIIYVLLQVLAFVGSFDNGGIFAAQLGAMLCGFIILRCWKRKSENNIGDDKMIDWGMKLLLVIVGINIVYLLINF